MDPMHVLATKYTDDLARRRDAAGWTPRPSRVRPFLRRIGTVIRPVRRVVLARRPRRSSATSAIGGRAAYPRPRSG